MSDQTVHSLSEVPGDATAHVGSRGGLYYNKIGSGSAPKTPNEKLEGPGYSILFYNDKGGYRVRYKGPNSRKILAKVKEGFDSGKTLKEIIHSIHGDE